jgi:heavy metal sensor kinase
MNFFHSIKFRFTLWYLLILGILLALLSGSIYGILAYTLYNNFDESLHNRAKQLAGFKDIVSIVASGTFEEEFGEFVSFYYYDQDQLRFISQNKQKISIDPKMIRQAIDGANSFVTIKASNNLVMRVFISSYTPDNPNIDPDKFSRSNARDDKPLKSFNERKSPKENDRPEGEVAQSPEIYKTALVVGRPVNDIESALEQLLHLLFISVPLTVLLAGGGGIFLARRAFMPIEKITETATEIEATDLSRRIDVRSKDEVGRLAATLNQMIARLENAFIRQKEFTSDASHELRAPLAVIQAEATLTLQKARQPEDYVKSMEVIAQETEHLASIINQLLTLARADEGKGKLKFEKVNLADFIRDICSDVEIVCQEKNLVLQQDLSTEVLINGDVKNLGTLFHNLLDNAIRYTEEGGSITIRTGREGPWAMASISDTGIGIPSDEQSLIFERFYRVDKVRSRSEGGSGLGLAICRQIATLHGGTIEVESEPGKGSIFHVRLPVIAC